MGSPITTAYTDYPSGVDVRKVVLLSYDGNKYASVRFADGTEEDVKTCYIRRDPKLTRFVPRVQWHLLAGGNRKTYKRRHRKTSYHVYPLERQVSDGITPKTPEFRTQAQAVAYAIRVAGETGEAQEVLASTMRHNVSKLNFRSIECRPNGEAVAFDHARQRRMGKFLRGYGKHASAFR